MIERVKVVPELNYWMDIILHNSPLNEKFFKLPIPLDASIWWQKPTVLNLLFNETFYVTEGQSSSSSSSGYIFDDSWFTIEYRKADVLLITDKKLLRRLTIYAGLVDIYVANIPENGDVFGTYKNSDFQPTGGFNPTPEEILNAWREVNRDIVSYTGRYYPGTTVILTPDQKTQLGLPYPTENIFNITSEELDMLERLFLYKTDQAISISDIIFDSLTSPLSKCIYVYLDWEINESLEYFSSIEPFTNGTNVLHSLYEKYVIDHIYRVITKKYFVNIYTNDRVDDFTGLEYDFMRIKITEDQELEKRILMPGFETPYEDVDVYIAHNGVRQEIAKDYIIENIRPIETDQEYVESYISWTHDRFKEGDELYCLWSFEKTK